MTNNNKFYFMIAVVLGSLLWGILSGENAKQIKQRIFFVTVSVYIFIDCIEEK